MKHCDKCGTFYSDSLDGCPKCSVPLPGSSDPLAESRPAPDKTVKKHWAAILIGIPALILAYFIIIGILRALTQA